MFSSLLQFIGLSVLTNPLSGFVSEDNSVAVQCLANGIKTFVQESSHPQNQGAFRVVIKKAAQEQLLYAFDGEINCLDDFFSYCEGQLTDHPSHDRSDFARHILPALGRGSSQEVAVIAVGDFPVREMQQWIEDRFSHLSFDASPADFNPIQVDQNSQLNKVALRIAYPSVNAPIRNYSDLKAGLTGFLLQEMFQIRLEHCVKGFLHEGWVHPHPRFLLPVAGYAMTSEEHSENLLSFFLLQIEKMRSEGFGVDEFLSVKHRFQNFLNYLSSKAAVADDRHLASYYVDQFLAGGIPLSYEKFINDSIRLVDEINMSDIYDAIPEFFAEDNRSIQIVYPQVIRGEALTEQKIEGILDDVTAITEFYEDAEYDEGDLYLLNENAHIEKKRREEVLPALLVSNPMRISHHAQEAKPIISNSTDPYYDLPLTDTDMRNIKYIITTMAERGIAGLLFRKGTLEKRGKKIEHIHPMRFIGFIVSDSELRDSLHVIRKSSFKWDAFIDGFSKKMKDEKKNDNIKPYLTGFCQLLKVKQEDVMKFVHKEHWEELVEFLM